MYSVGVGVVFLLAVSCEAFLSPSVRSVGRIGQNVKLMAVESTLVDPISSINGEVTLPGSKSLSNRVLLLAALAEGTTRVENLLDSECYMLIDLKRLLLWMVGVGWTLGASM